MFPRKISRICLATVALSAFLAPIRSGAADAGAGEISFNRDIRPILSDKCFACHGPDARAREAGLRLDRGDSATAKLDSGAVAIVPGKPGESELIRRVTVEDADEAMPPRKFHKRVGVAEVEKLRRWIAEGAPYDTHWAFEAPKMPPFPKVDASRVPKGFDIANAIDLFVTARLQRESDGPTQQGRADDRTLLRRVTLDLTGLPPSPEEGADFVRAVAAFGFDRAYEEVVDDLLRSPRHGEHMAWQWLDMARYADSDGYESDPLRTMWPWRDWVVEAFNRGLPYDRFIVEQLAGDLLPDPDMRQVLATGFNRNHRLNNEGGIDPEEWLVEYVCDRAETTATVFMGLTWQCGRCHDHKYDPVTQRDYYRMFAFFRNIPEIGSARGDNAPPVLQVSSLANLEEYQRALEKIGPLQARLATFEKNPDFAKARDAWIAEMAADEKARLRLPGNIGKTSAGDWNAKLKAEAGDWFLRNRFEPAAALRREMRPVEAEVARLQGTGARVMVMEELPEPRETRILERGVFDRPLEIVTAGTPEFLPPMAANLPRNRLGLAKWLADPAHPLTARVMVNRVWERFFGTGLVKTQEDFGSQGEPPSNPELLDYLAVWFSTEAGWDIKALQREIVTSATYRQSSDASAGDFSRDPENRLLARGPRYRLPAAILRDQALAAGGLLVGDLGGPPVKPYQPPGLWKEIIKGRVAYTQDKGDSLYRRSLYTLWRRAVKPPLMVLLDSNERDMCAVTQKRTNTPLQALLTMNDVTFVEASRGLAVRMIREGGQDEAGRLRRGMELAIGRPPEPAEIDILATQIAGDLAHFVSKPDEAKALIGMGESPAPEDIAPELLAAYTNAARVLLNLDETLTKE